MSTLGTAGLPLRVAIVGSGPSGFYAAEALFKSGLNLSVDMFDRLPVPFGLVRGGVAPDHPKIKSVTRVYDKIAANPGYAFLGNVTIGRDISVEELSRFYDCVIFASGAETDNRLGISGEDLPGSHTATEFVGWYNGHPDYRDRVFDLSSEVAAVVGQGNVAMDVSRILSKTVDELRGTDIAEHALDALAESKVKEIHLIGRRGPVQAKFTLAEIKEFGELDACDPVIDPSSLQLDPASQAELDDPDNQHSQKNFAVLRSFAERGVPSKSKRFHIRFLESPVEIRGSGKVESLVLERNRLEGEPFKLRAVGTGEKHEMPCGLVFRSVGYRGVPVPGVPFDERKGRIPNEDGRILKDDRPWAGHYAVGWIKRGPSGVIGTNKPDSQATAAALLADVPSLSACAERDTSALVNMLRARGVRPVRFADWQRIDAAEIERGKAKGKPREKFCRVAEMLSLLDA
ncbi:MAG: NADP oxidoreductase [Candidatus Hydrogenedentes bacterium]|nr:NADP oxidoreductase [Candidatus Hydrogenedentota bacterium]